MGEPVIKRVGQWDHLDEVARVAFENNFRAGSFSASAGVALLPLRGGFCSLVDEQDFEMLSAFSWQVMHYHGVLWGYPSGPKATPSIHRLLLPPPAGMLVDHRNRLILDNRRSNLRLATEAQNRWNSYFRKRSGVSQFVGVDIDRNGKWIARITHNKTVMILGQYDTEVEAAQAYDAKCLELRGEFAVLNLTVRKVG